MVAVSFYKIFGYPTGTISLAWKAFSILTTYEFLS
jgi:hypothetical protein